jgi:hypothetical protein
MNENEQPERGNLIPPENNPQNQVKINNKTFILLGTNSTRIFLYSHFFKRSSTNYK